MDKYYEYRHTSKSANARNNSYIFYYFSMTLMSTEENMRLMKTLDDAWNSQDWDTFSRRHTEDVIVRWPGQFEPTRGLKTHRNEGMEMFKIFPDNHVQNNPYKVLFGQGDWTCSIAVFTGTHKGPMKGPGDKTNPPANKKFQVDFCTVAHWRNGQIDEENLFYDQTGMMRQLGLTQ
jgi:predicted ester cyclase